MHAIICYLLICSCARFQIEAGHLGTRDIADHGAVRAFPSLSYFSLSRSTLKLSTFLSTKTPCSLSYLVANSIRNIMTMNAIHLLRQAALRSPARSSFAATSFRALSSSVVPEAPQSAMDGSDKSLNRLTRTESMVSF